MAEAISAIPTKPPQQGTSMRATVMPAMSLALRMAASFSTCCPASSSFGQPPRNLTLQQLWWKPAREAERSLRRAEMRPSRRKPWSQEMEYTGQFLVWGWGTDCHPLTSSEGSLFMFYPVHCQEKTSEPGTAALKTAGCRFSFSWTVPRADLLLAVQGGNQPWVKGFDLSLLQVEATF